MIEMPVLWLAFLLGLRHALDPDHIAVIDNIVFRTADARPRLAPWTGSFFAAGHSLSVGAVAIGVSLFASAFTIPQWIASVVDSAVIFLLIVVGSLNLAALLKRREYTPVGWRANLVPLRLRASTHPFAIVLIGIVFGLVFDTATQAAAWGAAATAKGGTIGAILIAAVFAAGMLFADTADSQIVARLLRNGTIGQRYAPLSPGGRLGRRATELRHGGICVGRTPGGDRTFRHRVFDHGYRCRCGDRSRPRDRQADGTVAPCGARPPNLICTLFQHHPARGCVLPRAFFPIQGPK